MSEPINITIEMIREKLYAAVVSDALDALGYKNQSPRVPLPPQTAEGVLIGRCKTTQWEDIDFEDQSKRSINIQWIDPACLHQLLRERSSDGGYRGSAGSSFSKGKHH